MLGTSYVWHNHKIYYYITFSEGAISSLVSDIALICTLPVDKYRYDQMISGNKSLGICP